jgi:hypothetical protein
MTKSLAVVKFGIFVLLTALIVGCPLACAQQDISSLPVCHVPLAGEFPQGPSVGVVVDSDYAYASVVVPKNADGLFVDNLLAAKRRPVAPGEVVAFTGASLDASSMIAVIGGKPVSLTQGMPANMLTIGMGSKVILRIPADAVPDSDGNGNIEVAILGSNGPVVCRGNNSPFKLALSPVADAVYGFPLDADHPLISGFARLFNATEIVVDSKPVMAVAFGTEAIANLGNTHGTAEVRKGGVVVATFQLSEKPSGTIAHNPR